MRQGLWYECGTAWEAHTTWCGAWVKSWILCPSESAQNWNYRHLGGINYWIRSLLLTIPSLSPCLSNEQTEQERKTHTFRVVNI